MFDGPITNLLSILCILIEVLSRAHAKEEKINKISLNIFKFGICIGCFSGDNVTSMTAKGLNTS